MKSLVMAAIMASSASPPETRISIAVVDTGINTKDANLKRYICKDGLFDATGYGIHDVHGHGTNIAGIIVAGLDPTKYCLHILKYYHDKTTPDVVRATLQHLATLGPAYLNYSSSGNMVFAHELALYGSLLKAGTKIFVAAGNDALNLDATCSIFPACYKLLLNHKNYTVVSNASRSSNKAKFTVLSDFCGEYAGESICGTSQSSAILLNRHLRGIK